MSYRGHCEGSTLTFSVTGIGWKPLGSAKDWSEESVEDEYGGIWYFLSTVGNLGPFPSGYIP